MSTATTPRPAKSEKTAKPNPGAKTKVAILGGGVGSMVTAFELTHPDNPKRDEYDITLYQLGWRVGGKGASGRNRAANYRIEEHGLHIWFGFYDNAFRVIQDCYKELDRAPDAPLATWDEAFKPHRFGINKERVDGKWVNWVNHLPLNDATPGQGPFLLSIWSYIKAALFQMKEDLHGYPYFPESPTGDDTLPHSSAPVGFLERISAQIETKLASAAINALLASHFLASMVNALAGVFVRDLGLFVAWRWRSVRDKVATDPLVRQRWIMTNFYYGTIRGVIESNVIGKGFRSINDQEFREWIGKYLYDDGGITLNSAFMITIYDGSFAYVNGDNRYHDKDFPPNANMAAGVVAENGMRTYLGYKGSPIWKMHAGMGDVVFAPLYEVLKRRGVKFKFFHRVRELQASADGSTIDSITIGEQVELVPNPDGSPRDYAPLIDVKGLPCWPSRPLWDQIVDGKEMQEKGIDFESYFPGWPDAHEHVLHRGVDFDVVIQGISIGGLPYVCQDLIRKSAKWKAMVDNIQTVRTQAAQIWLGKTAYELGWTMMRRPILTGYDVSPLDTWADMTELIEHEAWGAVNYPLNLAYFVGCMLDEEPLKIGPYGPTEPREFMNQNAANAKARKTTREFLEQSLGPIFPNAYTSEGNEPPHFDWGLLVDSHKGAPEGPNRLDTQYFRGNVQPTERYVLSVAGSDKFRLPSHDRREFTNMYLAGDWTDCGLNVGCVEAAATSALMASRALSGYPTLSKIFHVDGSEPR